LKKKGKVNTTAKKKKDITLNETYIIKKWNKWKKKREEKKKVKKKIEKNNTIKIK
jgi:hypothetical protein